MTQPDLEILRVAVREQIEKEGLRPFSERTGVPLGRVRGFLDGRDSPFSSIRQLAEAVGIDWYIGATGLFGERIKIAREEAGLSVAALSRRTGNITASAISQLESGQSKGAKPDNLVALSKALGVEVVWLATGEGPMKKGPRSVDQLNETAHFMKEAGAEDENTEPVDVRRPGRVPLLSWVQAGEWTSVESAFEAHQSDEWVLCPVPHSEKTFVLRVRGASMEPEYHDGDWIFIDPEGASENGSHVVVMLDTGKEATFKKLVVEGDEKFLEALNPDWPDRVIRINGNASILGVVVFSGKPR
ncbi:putative HTH-type transcriptional regulator [Rhodobiaceae bacterium]|nr:putative HTH-type transcriptional regulator [Rhodobiaceae bacterium]